MLDWAQLAVLTSEPGDCAVSSQPACHECHQLWGHYISALLHQTRVERDLYFARIGQEAGSVEALQKELEAVAIATRALRASISRHEQTHHTSLEAETAGSA